MQQPAQAAQYIVIRADNFRTFNNPEFTSLLIRQTPLYQTPDVAKEAFFASFVYIDVFNIKENYIVVEVTQNSGRYTLKIHSHLTNEEVLNLVWVRSLKKDAAVVPQVKGNPLSPSPIVPPPAAAAFSPSVNPPPQPAAAPPSSAQIISPFWGKPAAKDAAAPALQRDRRDDRRVEVDLSAMKNFLGMTNEQFNDLTTRQYFAELQNVLPKDFFQMDVGGKFNWIMNNRDNGTLFPALKSNPPLACLFLDKIVAGNPRQRSSLNATRFNNLYIITDILDQREFKQRYGRLSIAVQVIIAKQIFSLRVERLRLQMLQRQVERARARQPLVVPEVKEGVRTQLIHELHDNDKLSRPIEEDLRCPLTGRLFIEPVKLTQKIDKVSHTFYFEKYAIVKWYKTNPINPINRVPFKIEELQEAPEMTEKLIAFKESVADDVAAYAKEHPSPSPANPPIPKSPNP